MEINFDLISFLFGFLVGIVLTLISRLQTY